MPSKLSKQLKQKSKSKSKQITDQQLSTLFKGMNLTPKLKLTKTPSIKKTPTAQTTYKTRLQVRNEEKKISDFEDMFGNLSVNASHGGKRRRTKRTKRTRRTRRNKRK